MKIEIRNKTTQYITEELKNKLRFKNQDAANEILKSHNLKIVKIETDVNKDVIGSDGSQVITIDWLVKPEEEKKEKQKIYIVQTMYIGDTSIEHPIEIVTLDRAKAVNEFLKNLRDNVEYMFDDVEEDDLWTPVFPFKYKGKGKYGNEYEDVPCKTYEEFEKLVLEELNRDKNKGMQLDSDNTNLNDDEQWKVSLLVFED